MAIVDKLDLLVIFNLSQFALTFSLAFPGLSFLDVIMQSWKKLVEKEDVMSVEEINSSIKPGDAFSHCQRIVLS